jgi:UDP-N-acetylglucosamine acyltransferase
MIIFWRYASSACRRRWFSSCVSPLAVIAPSARIGANVTIGPFSVIGPHVTLGDGVRLHSHVVIQGDTHVGSETEIHPFAHVGGAPQDRKHRPSDTSSTRIGSRCQIREHVTVHGGTVLGGGLTEIGPDVLLMAASHVAHDW